MQIHQQNSKLGVTAKVFDLTPHLQPNTFYHEQKVPVEPWC